MHDFLLAKEIIESLEKIIEEKNIKNIKSVSLEIGNISMAHDGHPEHLEEIDPENLRFGLESMSKQKDLGEIEFKISKSAEDSWKITNIETN